MPSPKSGTAGSPVPPAAPQPALEADNATPGGMAQIKTPAQQSPPGQYTTGAGSPPNPTTPYKPPQTPAEKAQKTSWIEIVLVGEDKKPIPGEKYSITLPDGKTVAAGTLDDKGFARVDGIDPGSCQITFPDLDTEAWVPA